MRQRTISSDPRKTPHKILLNHSPPSRASSGGSTNSARGFSSSVNVNDDPVCSVCGGAVLVGADGGRGPPWVTVGLMFKKDLKPT